MADNSTKKERMIDKGIQTFEIGDCLNEQVRGKSTKKNNGCIANLTHCDLFSLIVNRWYYGLFLMAKACIGYEDRNEGVRHRDHDASDKANEQGVWAILEDQNPEYDQVRKLGEGLYGNRNTLDYTAPTRSNAEAVFDLASSRVSELRTILLKLTGRENSKT